MKIRLIEHNETNLLNKCEVIANQYYIENSILLGDLHLPCIKLTEIFGLFDNDELISFFVKFNGFPQPSIVIPFNTNRQNFNHIMKFLQKTISGNFSIVTYDLTEAKISRFFTVEGYTSEYCMIINKKDIPPELESPLLKKVQDKNLESIDSFYKSIDAYPWNPIQLESGFYFYIEHNNQIVACGGTHFENKKSAQLGNIFVLEEYRGKQYGKLITTAITQEILSKKDFASLFVFQDNIPAFTLYKKLGFKIYKPVSIFFCKR
ncbi:MAG: GNAT family N-acetyltransferase [Asgard group archaeon]|nr:GNAT family N-acetyltransferase [Asgard group archaeon]